MWGTDALGAAATSPNNPSRYPNIHSSLSFTGLRFRTKASQNDLVFYGVMFHPLMWGIWVVNLAQLNFTKRCGGLAGSVQVR